MRIMDKQIPVNRYWPLVFEIYLNPASEDPSIKPSLTDDEVQLVSLGIDKNTVSSCNSLDLLIIGLRRSRIGLLIENEAMPTSPGNVSEKWSRRSPTRSKRRVSSRFSARNALLRNFNKCLGM